jgi:ribosomal protein L11 methyltransferase
MNYYAFRMTPSVIEAETVEILIAGLSDFPFESFEESPVGLTAYLPEADCTADLEAELNVLALQYQFHYEKTFIPYQNWNEVWESNFQPIQVEDFVAVRADFHPPTEGVRFDLVINPKMAFGTGHHETTYMMMQLMQSIDFEGTKVFDYGCGTGILAILASKLRSTEGVAVDIELASFDNTIENCRINAVENIRSYCGTLDNITEDDFDVILANINRNIIIGSLPRLREMLKPKGLMLISGFLMDDEKVMTEAVNQNGFLIDKKIQRGKWSCWQLTH